MTTIFSTVNFSDECKTILYVLNDKARDWVIDRNNEATWFRSLQKVADILVVCVNSKIIGPYNVGDMLRRLHRFILAPWILSFRSIERKR